MNQPIHLALIWHMHQPYYKDLIAGEYFLPWVRMHGIKDYYDMVAILEDYPNMKATFNLVPSLVEQIDDYVFNNAKDISLKISEKDPKALSDEELVYLLKNFFMANWETMIKPYSRYHAMLLKRGRFASDREIADAGKRFTRQEILDLQVWFNLTWFGFIYKKTDPVIMELLKKGTNFTIEDKVSLLAKQKELLSKIVPKHKELMEKNQIEVTTSPFYHPILPLLCDTSIAKESMPEIKLPCTRFKHPEDAMEQIKRAIKFHEEHFGSKPAGMWPSEGSVSTEVAGIAAQNGIKWIATDEGVLSNSFRKKLSPEELYKPYTISKDGNNIHIIFRNHFLSDQIGFVYQRWRAKDAVADFKHHLHNIKASLPDNGKQYLISVILDGENAWEYFKDGGEEFLRNLYDELSKDPNIKPVLPKDFIQEFPPEHKIERLFPASWINNNFRIWIGHDEDNLAWDYLGKARNILEGQENETAWKELYVAEGSDWCWWFGDDHSSENDPAFDTLFRKHLSNIYQLLGKPIPTYLKKPIKQLRTLKPTREPAYYIEPVMDGVVTSYYEWLSAGSFDVNKTKGAMHQIDTVVSAIYYGFSKSQMFFRIDCQLDFQRMECKGYKFDIIIHHPNPCKLELSCEVPPAVLSLYKLTDNDTWEKVKELSTFGISKIIEIGLSFEEIGAKQGDEIQFSVVIIKDGNELEHWPRGGMLSFKFPDDSFELNNWKI